MHTSSCDKDGRDKAHLSRLLIPAMKSVPISSLVAIGQIKYDLPTLYFSDNGVGINDGKKWVALARGHYIDTLNKL